MYCVVVFAYLELAMEYLKAASFLWCILLCLYTWIVGIVCQILIFVAKEYISGKPTPQVNLLRSLLLLASLSFK